MNISDLWHAFVWPILLISLRTFYPYIKSKENKSFELQTLLIAFVLGWFLYLIIGFRIGSEIFYKYLQLWYSGTLRLVTMLEKKNVHYIGCLIIIVNNFIIFDKIIIFKVCLWWWWGVIFVCFWIFVHLLLRWDFLDGCEV